MVTLEIEQTKVTLYTNAVEYTNDFFDIPENVVLDTSNLPESAGFSSISDQEIWIYKGENCSFEELLSTVAHELGHIVEGGFKKNPPQKPRYNSKHELKATHYEDFTIKAYRVTNKLFDL